MLNIKSTYEKLLFENKIDQNKIANASFFGLKGNNLKETTFTPFFNQ